MADQPPNNEADAPYRSHHPHYAHCQKKTCLETAEIADATPTIGGYLYEPVWPQSDREKHYNCYKQEHCVDRVAAHRSLPFRGLASIQVHPPLDVFVIVVSFDADNPKVIPPYGGLMLKSHMPLPRAS